MFASLHTTSSGRIKELSLLFSHPIHGGSIRRTLDLHRFPNETKNFDSQTHKFPFPGCLKIHLTTRCRSEIRNPRTNYTREPTNKKTPSKRFTFQVDTSQKRKPDPTLSRHETKLFSDLNSDREVSFCARRHLPTDCMHYRNSSTRVEHKHNRKLCYRFSNY